MLFGLDEDKQKFGDLVVDHGAKIPPTDSTKCRRNRLSCAVFWWQVPGRPPMISYDIGKGIKEVPQQLNSSSPTLSYIHLPNSKQHSNAMARQALLNELRALTYNDLKK
ncbi:hypothetical protein NM688_g9389 [Phlebia brevispora]|uniref:Uncharacterized protein n=1 Tax=Phlebia brevispora TaxID=194682 RepID=A0ACC1RJQ4_9APHY|nr:hypothetical protein NM688_g9389 [Phlebia brevispora]